MVSIGKLSLGQERYYLEQAPDRIDGTESSGSEDYYLDPAEARGEWHGRAAARLAPVATRVGAIISDAPGPGSPQRPSAP